MHLFEIKKKKKERTAIREAQLCQAEAQTMF